ncbi:hypothetical protein Dimus_036268 [Dionaea muscipula]
MTGFCFSGMAVSFRNSSSSSSSSAEELKRSTHHISPYLPLKNTIGEAQTRRISMYSCSISTPPPLKIQPSTLFKHKCLQLHLPVNLYQPSTISTTKAYATRRSPRGFGPPPSKKGKRRKNPKDNNNVRGFGPPPPKKDKWRKNPKDNNNDEEKEEEVEDGYEEQGIIPEIVTNRMMSRMGLSVGIPLFLGILFFPFFYYLKVGLKIDVPTWVPLIVSFFFFGSALLGVSYGIVSSSWDPMREGSLLGWNEAQKNWPVFWQSLWGGSGKK